MRLVNRATAGTLESSDLMVTVAPADEFVIEIRSPVLLQFGDAIRESVLEVARSLGVSGAAITIDDQGALDCTIRARVETALLRAAKEG